MRCELENKIGLIGADEGTGVSVVKLRDSYSNIYGVNKGISMPVVQLENDFPLFYEGVTHNMIAE